MELLIYLQSAAIFFSSDTLAVKPGAKKSGYREELFERLLINSFFNIRVAFPIIT